MAPISHPHLLLPKSADVQPHRFRPAHVAQALPALPAGAGGNKQAALTLWTRDAGCKSSFVTCWMSNITGLEGSSIDVHQGTSCSQLKGVHGVADITHHFRSSWLPPDPQLEGLARLHGPLTTCWCRAYRSSCASSFRGLLPAHTSSACGAQAGEQVPHMLAPCSLQIPVLTAESKQRPNFSAPAA